MHHDHRYQAEFIDFCSIKEWKNPIAVTLTMKKSQTINGFFVSADPMMCTQNLRHFRNVLTKKILRNQARNKQIRCIAVREQNEEGRYHYHLALDRPDEVEPFRFEMMIRSVWQKSRWAHREIDVQRLADDGWINYMAKLKTKGETYSDAIDWENIVTQSHKRSFPR